MLKFNPAYTYLSNEQIEKPYVPIFNSKYDTDSARGRRA